MQITKTSSTDGFVVVDLPEAASARGIVRCARKILQDGAVNLARATTYTYAIARIPTSGASAGINAEGDARDAAVAAFVEEIGPRIADGSLRLTPGKGVGDLDLASWGPPPEPALSHDLALAQSVVMAAGAALDLSGTTVGIEAGAPAVDAIVAEVGRLGGDIAVLPLAELLTSGRRVLIVGSKVGVLHHENIDGIGDALVVGAAPLSITARGLAVARREGATVLPDFVSSAGPLLAAEGDDDMVEAVIHPIVAALAHEEGPYLGACYAAEEFLRTWASELPFGRPLA